MKKFKDLLLLLLICPIITTASEYPGAVFLMIYPGARAVGMGGAFTAIADDALATYYNPAGLGFQKSIDFSYNICDWLPGLYPGMYYEYIGLSVPVYKGLTFAFSRTYLNTGKTEVIDANGNYLGEYTSFDKATAWSISIAPLSIIGIEPIISFGFTLKDIYSFLVPDWVLRRLEMGNGGSGSALAKDYGILIRSPASMIGQLSFGFLRQNIGSRIAYTPESEGDPLPRAFKTGFSYKITANDIFQGKKLIDFGKDYEWLSKWFAEASHICIAFDIYNGLAGSWYSWGVEFAPFGVLGIRMGYFNDAEGARIGTTYSVGLDLKFLKIDFGSDADIYDFPTENWRVAVALNIGTPILSENGIIGSIFERKR
ncbi:MAG: PorV/PorQ family protein [candidate division WOR-3 bacterium]|nr:PorV/PorQ family protein [candidate division WOR-3 bacterium]